MVVVVNKIDRPAARPDWVVDSTFELFMDLGATDEQIEFPVVYASGVKGIAGTTPETMAEDLQPLFEEIVRAVSGADGCGSRRVLACGLTNHGLRGGVCEVALACWLLPTCLRNMLHHFLKLARCRRPW